MWTISQTLARTAVTLSLCVLASSALASGICVTCSGPEAVYRCEPEGTPLKPSDARLGLACITEIARRDRHQSCSVDRRRPDCEGPLRTVTATGHLLGEPPPEREAIAPPAPAVDKSSGPPETVAELAKRTAQSSKQQLDKATGTVGDVAKKTGGAVSDAAKKSWRCLSSFFSDC